MTGLNSTLFRDSYFFIKKKVKTIKKPSLNI
jgi:hypothetical protein